jgi:hypothetical protein
MRYAMKSSFALSRVNPAKLIAVLAAVACRLADRAAFGDGCDQQAPVKIGHQS